MKELNPEEMFEMFGKKSDGAAILAEHGRWMAKLRDDVKVLDQRLLALERRLSTVEGNLAELAKIYGRLDITLSELEIEGGRTRGRGR